MKSHQPDKKPSSLNLVRDTLTRQICSLLKWKILDGELTSGMRIWAHNLSEELGVSIAPVKEALLILAGEGLINNIPRRGSVVRTFSMSEMHELYQVRRLLEVEALDIMFSKNLVTDQFVGELQDINQKIGRLRKNGEFKDRSAAFELDWEFHQHFMQNCQQSLLSELYSRLNTQAQIIRYASWNIGPGEIKPMMNMMLLWPLLRRATVRPLDNPLLRIRDPYWMILITQSQIMAMKQFYRHRWLINSPAVEEKSSNLFP